MPDIFKTTTFNRRVTLACLSVFSFCSFAQQPVSGQQINDESGHADPMVVNSVMPEATAGRQTLTIESQANYMFADQASDAVYRGSSQTLLMHTSGSASDAQERPFVDVADTGGEALPAHKNTAIYKIRE